MPNETIIQEPTLPPPGDERREVLAARTDVLEEEIDKKSKDTFAVDPSKLEVDREVRYELDKGELDVSDKDPEYVYKWVQCESPRSNPSRLISQLQYRRVKVNGTCIRLGRLSTAT